MRQLDLFGVKQEEEKPVEKKQEIISFIKDEPEEIFVEEKEIIVKEKNVAPKKKVAAKIISKRGRKSYKEMDAEVDLIKVPEDEILFQKQYYSISEVANWFNVNTSLIRFWENEFVILKPRKNRKGDRLFRPEDVKNIQLIYHLVRQRKFSLEGAKKYLEANKEHAETNKQLIQSLTKLKAFLTELKTNLGE
jgi:DNA-binding transcriptional MerR regulator